MFNTKIISFFLITFSVFSSSIVLAKNPGKEASGCVHVETSEKFGKVKVVLNNRCDYQIFVAYCGDLAYSKKNCRQGGKNKDLFYTHTKNIDPGKKSDFSIKAGGSYFYAACVGRTGFGGEGISHPAHDNGHYACTVR